MSNETKWTKGPWVIDPATRPMEVCTVHHLPDDERTDGQGWAYVRGALGHWDVSPEETMANAHLIAAAPELYAALEAMLEDGVWAGCDWIPSDNAKQRADAALAKARGEQS